VGAVLTVSMWTKHRIKIARQSGQMEANRYKNCTPCRRPHLPHNVRLGKWDFAFFSSKSGVPKGPKWAQLRPKKGRKKTQKAPRKETKGRRKAPPKRSFSISQGPRCGGRRDTSAGAHVRIAFPTTPRPFFSHVLMCASPAGYGPSATL
jgi:hypothetical protein